MMECEQPTVKWPPISESKTEEPYESRAKFPNIKLGIDVLSLL